LFATGQAGAQWQVTDEVTHEGLDRVNNTLEQKTNGGLKDLYNQQKIGDAKRSTDGGREKPDDPAVTLEKDKPSEVSARYGEETRCPEDPKVKPGSLAHDQWKICKEIVKTELAQYNYALSMREVALERQTRLKAIEDARLQLNQEKDTGKLASNSNELLALLARMEADRQQYRTYMDAYAARVKFLVALREALGQRALNGKNTAGEIALGLAALGALEVALDAKKTPKKGRYHD
jgi:hypothetical protein